MRAIIRLVATQLVSYEKQPRKGHRLRDIPLALTERTIIVKWKHLRNSCELTNHLVNIPSPAHTSMIRLALVSRVQPCKCISAVTAH